MTIELQMLRPETARAKRTRQGPNEGLILGLKPRIGSEPIHASQTRLELVRGILVPRYSLAP